MEAKSLIFNWYTVGPVSEGKLFANLPLEQNNLESHFHVRALRENNIVYLNFLTLWHLYNELRIESATLESGEFFRSTS
jgi:hypothetical protein